MLVVQDLFLTKTAELADVVLPATAAWAESEGTVTNSERRVQRVRAAVAPPPGARDDLADHLRPREPDGRRRGASPDPEHVWEEVRRLSPVHAGMSYARLEAEGGLQWPCCDETHPGELFLHSRLWEDPFPGNRVPFVPVEHDPPVDKLTDEYPIRLTTGRRLDSYNTGVQTAGYTSPLRRGESLDISPEDADGLRPDRRRGRARHVAPRHGRRAHPRRRVAPAGTHLHDHALPGRRRGQSADDRRDRPEVRHGRVQGDGHPDRQAQGADPRLIGDPMRRNHPMAAKTRTSPKAPAPTAATKPATKASAKANTKSTRSKAKASARAKDVQEVASVVSRAEARDGARRVVEGAEVVRAAAGAAAIGRTVTIEGAADLTRGVDEVEVARRVADLGDVVAAAGISDVEQGAELIATSEDIALLGAVVGAISEEDLDRGLEIARVSGELGATAAVVSRIGMPVLAAFLATRGDQLLGLSVDAILRAGGTRAIARALAETGDRVGTMGDIEAAEGIVRLAAAQGLAERSDDLADSGAALAFEGFQEMVVGEEIRETAVDAAAVGGAQIVQGAEELGSAGALGDVAADLKGKKR